VNKGKLIGIGLLVAGAVLLYLGVESSDSFTSFWSKWYEGMPSDKAIGFYVLGGVACAAGAFILWSSRNKN